eukprot:s8260_g2.t1
MTAADRIAVTMDQDVLPTLRYTRDVLHSVDFCKQDVDASLSQIGHRSLHPVPPAMHYMQARVVSVRIAPPVRVVKHPLFIPSAARTPKTTLMQSRQPRFNSYSSTPIDGVDG